MRKAIFATLDKIYAMTGLPETALKMKNEAYSAGYVHAAAYAYFAGDFENGKKDLSEAIRLNPELAENRYHKLIQQLNGWTNDPRAKNRTDFYERIMANAPAEHPGLARELGRARADVLLEPLFGSPKANWAASRNELLKVVRYKPEWLLNRGVLRMLVYAWLRI
jgi:hypothetical protein